MLHSEKSPAVLSIMQSPLIRYVNITKCEETILLNYSNLSYFNEFHPSSRVSRNLTHFCAKDDADVEKLVSQKQVRHS